MSGWLERVAHQRRAIVLLLALVVIAGTWTALKLPASILPEITFPRITVIADAGERPGEEMVRAVTRPIETALRRVPGIREVRSTTSRGSSEIQVDCDWRADIPSVLQQINARVESVRGDLPPDTHVESRQMSPAIFPVIGFSLTSRTKSLVELRDLAVTQLQPELQRLPGVSEVVVQGGGQPEADVTLDPRALAARHLGLQKVVDAITTAEALPSAGLLDANGELYLTLGNARPAGLDALAAVPVPLDSGRTVPLARLGTIALGEVPQFTRYAAGEGPAVLVNVLRRPDASILELSNAVRRWLTSKPVPPDVALQTFYDQSDLVRASVGSVRDSLLVGALMAIVILALFLGSWRLGLAGAVVLPGSMAFTICGLALAHQSLNMMTLGGIAAAVGLVLDDAIVVIEHLAHRAAADPPVPPRAAMAEISSTMVGSSLCTIAILVPFIWLGGVTGAFFRVLALSMTLMLTSSLLLCFLVLPWMGPGGRAAHGAGTARRGFAAWRARLSDALGRAVPHPGFAWLAVALLVAAIVPLRATLGSGFLPEMDEGAIIMDYVAPPGLSAAETDRMLQQVERVIRSLPDVLAWSRRTGDQLGFFITEPNRGDYVIRLNSGHRRSSDEVADDLRQRIGRLEPALDLEFGQLVEDVIGDLTTSPEPIEVRLLGEDRPVLEQRAQLASAMLDKVKGVVDVRSGVNVSGPNLNLVPNQQAQRLGLGSDELATRVSPWLQGIEAGEIPRGLAHVWPVRVRLGPAPRPSDPLAVAALPVETAPGRWQPLSAVAAVQVTPGETEITRDDGRTMVAVTGRLSGRDLGSAMRDVRRTIARDLPGAPGMSVRYAGLYAEQQSSFRALTAVLLAAAFAVLLVLLVWFRSWRVAGSVLALAAASLAGVFALLHVGGATFNIASFVGAIMVVGICGENAFFLVAAWAEGWRRAGPPPVDPATRRARALDVAAA
ncbi:MAG TPA: efflux RND transporter permease subunit, partial [Candidatus Eisenbacteria bacterium]|nr:efflux RND transporter permease subunit [Candidatus Eisenbacteria bacterium]